MIRLYLNDKDIFKAKLPKEQVNRIVRIDKKMRKQEAYKQFTFCV